MSKSAPPKKPRVPREKKIVQEHVPVKEIYSLEEPQDKTMTTRSFILLISWPIVIILAAFIMLHSLSSCTFAVTNVHTQGLAEDVVDSDQKTDPTVSPNINVPISGIPLSSLPSLSWEK